MASLYETYKSTKEIPVPHKLIDQVIGQDKAVELVKKAAEQRRNILFIGTPGTGKSMLAQAMAELLPPEELEDVLVYPNPNDENKPLARVIKTYSPLDKQRMLRDQPMIDKRFAEIRARLRPGEQAPSRKKVEEMLFPGQGRQVVAQEHSKFNITHSGGISLSMIAILIMIGFLLFIAFGGGGEQDDSTKIMIAAAILGAFIFAGLYVASSQISRRAGPMFPGASAEPKLIVDNTGKTTAPFIDGTGSKAGALFGDVRHDPLQSGGLGTPAHLRVEAGAIHFSNKGVLFMDEVSSLKPTSQQDLLTAMQEKKFPITGRSELSSGAIVRTEPIPCDFVLVAAGNTLDLQNMHPALRSRIRGAGYEIYLEDTMPDTPENRKKLVQFVAQEVTKDKKIPHFTREAVDEIVEEAKKRAGRKNKLTLRFRELGGIVRAAGDIANMEHADLVTRDHVLRSKGSAKTMEQQMSAQFIEQKKDYQIFVTTGKAIGKVNGLAVLGDAFSGLILPIVAEVTTASSKSEGKIIATGKLGEIAKEAVKNVSAIFKKHFGKDFTSYDVHIQFLQTYEGVEGDSASVSIALAVISALEEIPIDQSIALTGSLSVRGEVLPVGGVTGKIEAAIEAGLKKVLIPARNREDVYLGKENAAKIEIVSCSNIIDVLENALVDCPKKSALIKQMMKTYSG
ncbi:Archaeal Lon protease [Candidatus Gugararchaeum adminiculabundum]|nr:Archaeal Lon protease [Candidatus Gugararchaeum adminiculabundum]